MKDRQSYHLHHIEQLCIFTYTCNNNCNGYGVLGTIIANIYAAYTLSSNDLELDRMN